MRSGTVDVHARILFLPLGPSVLEPDLHLGLRQTKGKGEVQSLADGQVSCLAEFVLEGDQLLVGEGRSDAAGLAGRRTPIGAVLRTL